MIRFNLFKRISKKPLLVLAVLALAVVAGGATVGTADAQTPTSYTIQLSFRTVTFPAVEDCEFFGFDCDGMSVYGTINGRTTSTGVAAQGARNLATWGNTARCGAYWNWDSYYDRGREQCVKEVDEGGQYLFERTPLCASHTHLYCTGNYQVNNNKISLTVKPGEQIRAGINLKNEDNADVCNTTKWVGPFTEAQLQTLSMNGIGMGMAFNGHASCTVVFNLQRIA